MIASAPANSSTVPELALEMRIKHLNSLGYGDENDMVQALKHTLAIKKKKPE